MTGYFDIHTHIIPHVDDGSRSMKESEEILKTEYADGVRNIFLTTHYRVGMFEPEMSRVNEQFLRVKEVAEQMGITVYLGCEFHANMDMIETLSKKERPTMNGGRCVLTEFKTGSEKAFIKERCYALLSHGYQPIIAHIERYAACRKDIGFIEDLYDLGCYIQINSQSLLGEDGFFMKQFCKKLVKEDLVHFIASDTHDMKSRKPTIGKCAEYLLKFQGEEYVRRIFIENPQKLILEAE